MPFQQGNSIGQDTRFKKGQSGNPAGRPPDKLRRFIDAELDKIEREATGKQAAATKLEVLAECIVVNVDRLFKEFAGDDLPSDATGLFAGMAELARI